MKCKEAQSEEEFAERFIKESSHKDYIDFKLYAGGHWSDYCCPEHSAWYQLNEKNRDG